MLENVCIYINVCICVHIYIKRKSKVTQKKKKKQTKRLLTTKRNTYISTQPFSQNKVTNTKIYFSVRGREGGGVNIVFCFGLKSIIKLFKTWLGGGK